MRLLPLLSIALSVPAVVSAQATLTTNARLRATPNGVLIATLHEGATVERGTTRGEWTRVTVQGYVYKTGIGGKRDTFRISAASDGVLLRASASPKGKQVASLKEGMGLVRVGSHGDWLEVRRTAWVHNSTLSKKAGAKTLAGARRGEKPAEKPSGKPAVVEGQMSGTGDAASGGTSDDATSTSHGEIADAGDSTAASGESGTMVAHRQAELRTAPGGKRMAAIDSSASVTVLSRERGWTLVRVEGWVPDSALVPPAGSMLTAISAADLRAEPDRYRGETVRWDVQKIALQTADPLRKELAPGEPYLLARGPGDEHSLLYLALPPSLVDQARRIEPLAHIVITARVRTGRSEASGVPLLDVLSIAGR
jgi:hypothetical protein